MGFATGRPTECIMLGGALQLMALGWANVGAAIAPDAALASVASAIILVKSGQFDEKGQSVAIVAAVTCLLTLWQQKKCGLSSSLDLHLHH